MYIKLLQYDFQALSSPCQEPQRGDNAVIVTASVQTCCFMPSAHQKTEHSGRLNYRSITAGCVVPLSIQSGCNSSGLGGLHQRSSAGTGRPLKHSTQGTHWGPALYPNSFINSASPEPDTHTHTKHTLNLWRAQLAAITCNSITTLPFFQPLQLSVSLNREFACMI